MENHNTLAKARLNCPSHNGVAQDIREALKRAGTPLSPYKLTLLCGRKPEQIKSALSQLMQDGGVVSFPNREKGPRFRLYTLYDMVPKESPKEPANGETRAGYITIGRGSRWGASWG